MKTGINTRTNLKTLRKGNSMIEFDAKEAHLVIQALANSANLAALHYQEASKLADTLAAMKKQDENSARMLRHLAEKDKAEKEKLEEQVSSLHARLTGVIEACESLQHRAEVARKNYQALLDEKTGLEIANAGQYKDICSLQDARDLHQRNYQEAADAREKLQTELAKMKELKTKAERELAAETKRMGDVIRKQEQLTNELTEKYRKNQELVLELLRNSITAKRALDESLIRDVFRILEVASYGGSQ